MSGMLEEISFCTNPERWTEVPQRSVTAAHAPKAVSELPKQLTRARCETRLRSAIF